jgi:hypothetical protein
MGKPVKIWSRRREIDQVGTDRVADDVRHEWVTAIRRGVATLLLAQDEHPEFIPEPEAGVAEEALRRIDDPGDRLTEDRPQLVKPLGVLIMRVKDLEVILNGVPEGDMAHVVCQPAKTREDRCLSHPSIEDRGIGAWDQPVVAPFVE